MDLINTLRSKSTPGTTDMCCFDQKSLTSTSLSKHALVTIRPILPKPLIPTLTILICRKFFQTVKIFLSQKVGERIKNCPIWTSKI